MVFRVHCSKLKLMGRSEGIFGSNMIVIHIHITLQVCNGVSLVVWQEKFMSRLECDLKFNSLVCKGNQYGRFTVLNKESSPKGSPGSIYENNNHDSNG